MPLPSWTRWMKTRTRTARWSCSCSGTISLYVFNQSINQSINLYRAIVQRRVLQCGYAESKRNVLRRILNVLTGGAVRQFGGKEFQSLGAATEKRRAAVSKLCSWTDRNFCVDDRSKRDWLYGLISQSRSIDVDKFCGNKNIGHVNKEKNKMRKTMWMVGEPWCIYCFVLPSANRTNR